MRLKLSHLLQEMLTMHKWIAIVGLCALGITPARADDPAQTNQVMRTPSAANTTVVGTLQRRHEMIAISLATNGIVYTVKDRATGNCLAEDIPEPELAILFPDVHRDLQRAVADGDARLWRRTPIKISEP